MEIHVFQFDYNHTCYVAYVIMRFNSYVVMAVRFLFVEILFEELLCCANRYFYWKNKTKQPKFVILLWSNNKRPKSTSLTWETTNTFAQSYDYTITLIKRDKKTINISFLRIEWSLFVKKKKKKKKKKYYFFYFLKNKI